MANLTVTAADVAPVKVLEQYTAPAAEAITVGQVVRLDTTAGTWTLANGSAAGEARGLGIAISAANQAGIAITAVIKGVLDMGDALGDLTYDDDVFLSDTDGTLADAAGTVSLIVGRVVPGFASTTPDKLLRVDL